MIFSYRSVATMIWRQLKNFILLILLIVLILLILLITHIGIECSICNEEKIKHNIDNNLNDILTSIPGFYDLKTNKESKKKRLKYMYILENDVPIKCNICNARLSITYLITEYLTQKRRRRHNVDNNLNDILTSISF
jgi:competence protein ComGC